MPQTRIDPRFLVNPCFSRSQGIWVYKNISEYSHDYTHSPISLTSSLAGITFNSATTRPRADA
jgi:hypothetical protein